MRKLIEQTSYITQCRELFGDERVSYRDALDRHYRGGAPDEWQDSFISKYATMHPWEDFAETWAHYLHISDTLSTVALGGVVLKSERADGQPDRDVIPRASYLQRSMDEMLDDWRWLSLLLNRASHAIGRLEFYPFNIPDAVGCKLAFVHEVVKETSRRTARPILA